MVKVIDVKTWSMIVIRQSNIRPTQKDALNSLNNMSFFLDAFLQAILLFFTKFFGHYEFVRKEGTERKRGKQEAPVSYLSRHKSYPVEMAIHLSRSKNNLLLHMGVERNHQM